MCDWCLRRSEEDAGFPGAGVVDGWEPYTGDGIKPSPLEEELVLLTAEPAIQPPHIWFLNQSLYHFITC